MGHKRKINLSADEPNITHRIILTTKRYKAAPSNNLYEVASNHLDNDQLIDSITSQDESGIITANQNTKVGTKQWDVNYTTSYLKNIESILETMNRKLDIALDRITTLETKNASLEKEVATLKTKNASLEKEVATLKTKNASLEKEVATLKTKNAALEKENIKLWKHLGRLAKKDVILVSAEFLKYIYDTSENTHFKSGRFYKTPNQVIEFIKTLSNNEKRIISSDIRNEEHLRKSFCKLANKVINNRNDSVAHYSDDEQEMEMSDMSEADIQTLGENISYAMDFFNDFSKYKKDKDLQFIWLILNKSETLKRIYKKI
ncbi:MAG: hypothetical protein ACRCZI_08440 [Cetobacterium sp.]